MIVKKCIDYIKMRNILHAKIDKRKGESDAFSFLFGTLFAKLEVEVA